MISRGGQKLRIFLVDDDEIIRKGMRKIIEKSNLGYTVVGEAADGEIALQEIESCGKIDLLITDISMPIMDGLELIKHIREKDTVVKIIVLSGFDNFSYVRSAFVDGAVDYLLKPINKGDFLALLQKISQSIEEESVEESYRKESKSLLVANTLNKLFHMSVKDRSEELINIQKIGLQLNGYYFVMITRVDNYYKQKIDHMEYAGKLERILNCLELKFENHTTYQALQYIHKVEIRSLVFSAQPLDEIVISKTFYSALSDIEEDEATYTMGVSRVYSGIDAISTAYLEAAEAADTRFYLGRSHRIEYHEIQNKCIDMNYEVEANAALLVHYIELCDYPNAKHVIHQVFLDLSYLKPSKFKRYIEEIIEILILRVKDFEAAILCYDHEYKFYIEHIDTYNELRSYMKSIIQNAIEYIMQERSKRSKKRFQIAKKYIEDHYMEPVTLNDVADHVELNASYFSNLFKTELGVNFSDYLLDTRMNMAKKLLLNPNIKVYEIGRMVGYEDAVSFGRAFKKKIGMSPKEYRNTVY